MSQEFPLLNKPYNRREFLSFLNKKLNFEQRTEPQKIEKDGVENMHLLGEVTTKDKKTLYIYEIQVPTETQLARNRVTLRNIVYNEIKDNVIDAAIAVYYKKNEGKWRLSFLSITPTLQAGKLSIEETARKRFTFLLGVGMQTRTASQHLAEIKKKSTLDDIKDAFSVEKLTQEFYGKLYTWYERAREKVQFPNDTDIKNHTEISLIRLLTRLLFIWFIKEKELINPDLFDKQKLQKTIDWEKPSSFYKAILQNLFFATLNREINERALSTPNSHFETTAFRYHKNTKTPLFNFQHPTADGTTPPELTAEQEQEKIKALFKQTPFLNGGLFECLDRELTDKEKEDFPNRQQNSGIRLEGFSNHPKNPLKIDNSLFFNTNIFQLGLIDIFNQYQFTAEESTPTDIDIALDPELLGRVFENLLASYNPETQNQARKETGSFYTPRQVVAYMVNQSFKHYLIEQFKPAEHTDPQKHQPTLTEQDIDELLDEHHEHHNFTDEQIKEIVAAIDTIKILDPAVGSGAFAMGYLQKFVDVLNKIDPENIYYKKQQLQSIEDMIDEESRSSSEKTIHEVFSKENAYNAYGKKLFLIESCIYGVDIQPIAIQICKLRFFISLVIEQDIQSDQDNYGIKPLPNLETKFLCADTLQDIGQFGLYKPVAEIKKLEIIRRKHFSARTLTTKKKYRQLDQEIRHRMYKTCIENNWEDSAAKKIATKKFIVKKIAAKKIAAKKIAEWDPYDQNTIADWFNPKWQFNVENGFHVVIGNPPYIQLQKNAGKLHEKYERSGYETLVKSGDIYQLFYEKGHRLLHKKNGHLCFITSNKWMRAGYGESTRNYFSQNTQLLILIDLGPKVFQTATVDTNILLFAQHPHQQPLKAHTLTQQEQLHRLTNKNFISMPVPKKNDSWVILNEDERTLKEKIEKIGVPLKKWNIKIYRGILTGYNNAFIIDTDKRNELVAEDPNSAEIIKPILRGRDIKRYHAQLAGLWVINSYNGYKINGVEIAGIDIDDYPAVKKHLDCYWDKIEKRQDQGETSYNLRSCAYLSEFEKEKIVWQRITQKPQFCLSPSTQFILDSMAFLSNFSLNTGIFLLSILNSKFVVYWVVKNVSEYGRTGYRLSNQYVENIPIPQIPEKEQVPFIKLADKIIADKKAGISTDTLEHQIDKMVYKLYKLTPAEIEIVEKT